MAGRWLALIALLSWNASAAPWNLTRSDHFEIYSQVDSDHTRPLFAWFEQLRAFFLSQPIVPIRDLPSVRVVLFASVKDYDQFRIQPASDAYYAGSDNRRYIAMVDDARRHRIAAHELAHVALAAGSDHIPTWLSEGLAEFFSTVSIDSHASEVGAEVPAHLQALRRSPWIPLPQLLSDPALRDDRASAGLFYAESWALTDMLLLSPEYAPRFPDLLHSQSLTSTLGKPTEDAERDLHTWIANRSARPIRYSGSVTPTVPTQTSAVSDFNMTLVLADMLAAGGELDHAEALLRALARDAIHTSDVSASLGRVALQRGDKDAARKEWKRAIDRGSTDADLCYRYALLVDAAGLPVTEIRAALERAVALRPDFDDARYRLALLEKNAGHYEEAVAQLRAMRAVAPARAFDYWDALADALNELGRRDDAIAAARHAAEHATTARQRATAAQLIYFAQTDLAVQFARDSSGRAQIVTTRVPHQSADDWNPFIEAGDDLRTVRGELLEIDCTTATTRIRVGQLLLAIPDPSRVRMRNAPDEFVCGPQEDVSIQVQYAAAKDGVLDGLVRGIDFDPPKN